MQRITRLPLLMDVSPVKTYSSKSCERFLVQQVLFNHAALTPSTWNMFQLQSCLCGVKNIKSFLNILSRFHFNLSLHVFVLQFLAAFGATIFCFHCAFLSLALLLSSPLSLIFNQYLSGDSGVYACIFRGFWILRKFGSISLLPTAFSRHWYFMCDCAWRRISFRFVPLLPLLQTICQKTPKDSAQYEDCKKALQGVSKVCKLKMLHTLNLVKFYVFAIIHFQPYAYTVFLCLVLQGFFA